MQQPLYDAAELEKDRLYVSRKLGLSLDEFEHLLQMPKRQHREFATNEWMHKALWAPGWRAKSAIVAEHVLAKLRGKRPRTVS